MKVALHEFFVWLTRTKFLFLAKFTWIPKFVTKLRNQQPSDKMMELIGLSWNFTHSYVTTRSVEHGDVTRDHSEMFVRQWKLEPFSGRAEASQWSRRLVVFMVLVVVICDGDLTYTSEAWEHKLVDPSRKLKLSLKQLTELKVKISREALKSRNSFPDGVGRHGCDG